MNSDPQPTYHERMQQIRNTMKDDPVLLALHDAVVSPHNGRKWSDILYPRYAKVAPAPVPLPSVTANPLRNTVETRLPNNL